MESPIFRDFPNQTVEDEHNIVQSVIILDEAQMLPPEKLAPTLSVLKGLVAHFGCTVVLCTATQPALRGRIGSGMAKFTGLEEVREIIPEPGSLFNKLNRTRSRFLGTGKIDWPYLAGELCKHSQVLCIVNRRQDCRDLWQALSEISVDEPVHLSALMCGEHRSQVIAKIKVDLKNGKRLRVVSTQLVEAGVDIDFPVVYRAMAGLDSLAQAAGRCNREDRMDGLGEVFFFNPPKPAPPGLLRKGEDAGMEIFRSNPSEEFNFSAELFSNYFSLFYGRVNDFGKNDFVRYFLTDAGSFQFQFKSAAQWYKLIDETGYQSIVVWFEKEEDSCVGKKAISSLKLIEEIKKFGMNRKRVRRLQRFSVNIPQRFFDELVRQGVVEEIVSEEGPTGLWAQCASGLYHKTFGLRLEGPVFDGEEMII